MSRPADRGKGEYWAFPDLALVAIDDDIVHPVAILDQELPRAGDILQAYGFSEKTPQSGPQADSSQIVAAGEAGNYLRVKDDQIVGGLSGCLVVNVRTRLVAGVVKASRDFGNALGGWIIPAAHIKSLPTVQAVPQQFDNAWVRALVAPLRDMFQGQQRASQTLPYRLLDGPAPPLGQIYVQQQVAGSQPVDVKQAISSGRHTVFVGPPGAGKSSLVQHICGEAARWWLSPAGDPPYGAAVPVRLSASALVGGVPLADVLATKTTAELGAYLDVSLPTSAFMRPPAPGVSWLVLVDGLDEVLDVTQRIELIKMLEHRIRSKDEIWRFVITTRPLSSNELTELIEAAGGSYRLLPFDDERVEEFAYSWFEIRDPANATEKAERFMEQAFTSRLTDVLRIPLLVTIAAIVFESHPDRGLPSNSGALYAEFIQTLLSGRYKISRDGLWSRMEAFGSVGLELAEWILENTELLLTKAAHRWFFDTHMPTIDAVQSVLSVLHPSPIYETRAWRSTLRLLLTETGLLVANGERLDWIHVSFVEYLAGRELVQKGNPRKWLWLAGAATTANLARFGLVEYFGDGHIPMRTLRRILKTPQGSLAVWDLMSSGDLLTDVEVCKLLNYALRRTTIWGLIRKERDDDDDLSDFLSRQAGVEGLRNAVDNPRRTARTRIEAAKALLSHTVADDRLFAARSLVAFAESRRLSARTRATAAAAGLTRQRMKRPQEPPGSWPEDDQAMLESKAPAIMLELAQRYWLTPASRLAVLRQASRQDSPGHGAGNAAACAGKEASHYQGQHPRCLAVDGTRRPAGGRMAGLRRAAMGPASNRLDVAAPRIVRGIGGHMAQVRLVWSAVPVRRPICGGFFGMDMPPAHQVRDGLAVSGALSAQESRQYGLRISDTRDGGI